MKDKKTSSYNESCSRCKSILCNLREKKVAGFDPLRHTVVFEQNQELPLERDGQSLIYCIKSGSLKLCHSNGSALRICGSGDIIGYAETFNFKYSAIALGPTEVCVFDRELFLHVQDKNPEISKEFIRYLSKEIALRDERILYLENFSVKNKVAATLLSLSKKFGTGSDHGVKINITLDRKTLAQLSGTVIESLARTLTELENNKVILRVGRHIYIRDIQELKRISSS